MSSLMKGWTFAKGKHKLKYPVYVEIKIDEIRADVVCAVGEPVKIISYAGKPLHNLERFLYPLGQFMRNHNVGRIDCGVIVNGSFNDTYRWVRSKNGPPADLKGAYITFILFDLPDLTDMPYWQRIAHRNRVASLLRDYGVPTVTPERHEASNEEEVYTPCSEPTRPSGTPPTVTASVMPVIFASASFSGLTLSQPYVRFPASYRWSRDLTIRPSNPRALAAS